MYIIKCYKFFIFHFHKLQISSKSSFSASVTQISPPNATSFHICTLKKTHIIDILWFSLKRNIKSVWKQLECKISTQRNKFFVAKERIFHNFQLHIVLHSLRARVEKEIFEIFLEPFTKMKAIKFVPDSFSFANPSFHICFHSFSPFSSSEYIRNAAWNVNIIVWGKFQ